MRLGGKIKKNGCSIAVFANEFVQGLQCKSASGKGNGGRQGVAYVAKSLLQWGGKSACGGAAAARAAFVAEGTKRFCVAVCGAAPPPAFGACANGCLGNGHGGCFFLF